MVFHRVLQSRVSQQRFGLLSLLLFLLSQPLLANTHGGASAVSPNQKPEILTGVGITEKLGAQVSIQSLQFTNEQGNSVQLSEYFQAKKPVLLSLAYYNCPTLCGVVLNAVLDGMKGLDLIPGKDFQVVNVSIDPTEKSDLAAEKKKNFLNALGKDKQGADWHFLVGTENQIKTLASEVGFGYRFDNKEQQYVHGAGVFVLTPEGKLSRILYGIQYKPSDLKLSLLEASNGKIGTIIDRILLFCYRYDPLLKTYSVAITRVLQGMAVLTVLVMAIFLAAFWWPRKQGVS